jgi:hypothetical protein
MSEPKKTTGRPQRQPNVEGGRGHRYVVKTNDVESAALEAEAASQGVTVARLMVESALANDQASDAQNVELTVTEKRDLITALWGLKSAIGGVAVNVNQVARYANETQTFPADAEELMLVSREVLVRVEEFCAEFYPKSKLAQARQNVAARTVWLDKGWASRIKSSTHVDDSAEQETQKPSRSEGEELSA